MTSQGQGSPEPVDLEKHGGSAPAGDPPEPDLDFDPYRFGLPDQPVPPEYAPPGYRPPQPAEPQSPYSPYGPTSPYGSAPAQTPYPPAQGQYGAPPPPYGYPPAGGPAGGHGYPPPGGPAGGHGYPPPAGGPQGGYGHPGYGPPQPHRSGKAVGALVCGILSIVLCWFAFFDAVLVIPALVLGIMVLTNRQAAGRGMALAGVICAVIGAVLAIVLTVVYVHIERDCRGVSSSQQQQCFRDKL